MTSNQKNKSNINGYLENTEPLLSRAKNVNSITTNVVPSTPTITLIVSPASVTEDGAANLVYTFTRDGSLTNPLTVNYTIGGTATNGIDYATLGTSVTFAAGSATATVTVDPTADLIIEDNETVSLTLASNAAYTIGTTTAVVGTITNDGRFADLKN